MTTNPFTSAAANDTSALYQRHWPALCAFARARGCGPHDAEDAVQELFAKLVAQGQHERAAAIADPEDQAAFLLARLRTHLIKRWRHRTRLCRGGGLTTFSLSGDEGRDIDVTDGRAGPDTELDRIWARGLIDDALVSVSRELHAKGRSDVWRCLERSVCDEERSANPLSGKLRVALHRAKARVRSVICQQCGSDEDVGVLLTVLA